MTEGLGTPFIARHAAPVLHIGNVYPFQRDAGGVHHRFGDAAAVREAQPAETQEMG